ncbi:hypothetical protein FA13DRAFT_592064 [Coprinellus micaceus]|uniref:Uncharacterized protein n=1 Tax=Coprinellus micaceus TaxID=71717 RepID=A0A4Y7SCE3_COPMI|nr:hypothetical protein FA13DRAFT_592064 [Coprinellus micaceus]
MSSHQLPAQYFQEGSPETDAPLAGDTGETHGWTDNALNTRATDKDRACRASKLNWGDLCESSKVGEASSGPYFPPLLPGQVPSCERDPPQPPNSPTSATLSSGSSHTRVGSDGFPSPGLRRDDGSIDGSPSGREFAQSPQGLPHRTAEDVLVAQPVGPPPLSATMEHLCAIDVVEDYERYKRGYC